MTIQIFTEAGSLYGFGHLARCQALAEGFAEKEIPVKFHIRGDAGDCEWLDKEYLRQCALIDDIAVVDSYYSNVDICRYIFCNFKNVLFFDDYNRLIYPGGYVINGVVGAEKIPYPKKNNIKYLLGSKYQPLRKPFWDIPEYKVREEISTILITMGGSDIGNKTSEVLEMVSSRFPNMNKKVVLGKGFKAKLMIGNIIDKNTDILEDLSADEMCQLMRNSDIAISAVGQTISELARIGIPTYGIMVTDNQKYNWNNWREVGFLLSYDKNLKLVDYVKRQYISQIGSNLIDGQGIRHIIQVVNNEN